jgi:hypothetical protein
VACEGPGQQAARGQLHVAMHHDEDGGATACVCPGGLLSTSHRVACGRAQVPRRRYAASSRAGRQSCLVAQRCVALTRAASSRICGSLDDAALDVEDGQFHIARKRPIRSSQ